jgi:hypothetical protein
MLAVLVAVDNSMCSFHLMTTKTRSGTGLSLSDVNFSWRNTVIICNNNNNNKNCPSVSTSCSDHQNQNVSLQRIDKDFALLRGSTNDSIFVHLELMMTKHNAVLFG